MLGGIQITCLFWAQREFRRLNLFKNRDKRNNHGLREVTKINHLFGVCFRQLIKALFQNNAN